MFLKPFKGNYLFIENSVGVRGREGLDTKTVISMLRSLKARSKGGLEKKKNMYIYKSLQKCKSCAGLCYFLYCCLAD